VEIASPPHKAVSRYRGNSPIRRRLPLGPYSRGYAWGARGALGGWTFLMGEVSLYMNIWVTRNQNVRTRTGVSCVF